MCVARGRVRAWREGGRAHPGESPASYMMKGVLEFLTGPDERAAWLRCRHVFKIVPVPPCRR